MVLRNTRAATGCRSLPAHTIAHAEEVGQAHVRARLKSGDGATIHAIAFRAAGQKLGTALLKSRGRSVHVAGTLSVDRWQGNERIQLRMIDAASADPVDRMRSGMQSDAILIRNS
jgi:single-stranded-DNA-specific exonuclease